MRCVDSYQDILPPEDEKIAFERELLKQREREEAEMERWETERDDPPDEYQDY